MVYSSDDCKQLAADLFELRREAAATEKHRDQLQVQLKAAEHVLADQQADHNASYRQLVEIERALAFDEIARGIEHRLFNALTPVEGYTELLLAMPERLADPAQANAYLTAILEAARDAKGTLDTVREFYYSTGNVDLQEHSEASKLLAAALQQEGVGRSTELAPGEAATKALSPREWDVLRLLADGMKNREIAETLFVSENTVKTHIRGILTKLSLKNRTQAATFALLDSRAY